MSEGPQRPQRNAPRPNRFNQSSESRATAGPGRAVTVGPGRAVLPGFSKGNPRAEDRHVPNSTDSIGSTTSCRAKGGSKPVARQSLGEERADDGQDGASGGGDGFGGPGARSGGSSRSFGVSQGHEEGDASSSDVDSIDFDMSASAVQARAAQSDEDLIGLGDECETTAPESVSPDCGTAPAAFGTPALVVAASASSSSRTTEREKFRKSLERAKGKRYQLWTAGLLRHACAKRGIMRMTRVKDVDVLSASLADDDKAKNRGSPYMEDLYDDSSSDKSGGKPPTPKGLPAGAVLMTRTALKKGMIVGPESVLKFGGQEYNGSELLAIIAKEDKDSGETAVNTRRTKNCIPRLLCLIVSDKHRPDFLQARLQCSRQELDNKETGKNRGVWTHLACDFWDENCQVRNITDEQMVDDIDPNKVSQPEATAKKVYEMYNETKSLWIVAHGNYKKSGSHAPWKSFCYSNRNVWYFGVAVQLYPDLIEVCSNLLPDDVARKLSGTQDTDSALGSTGTVEGDRKRRADSKVRSAESSTKV